MLMTTFVALLVLTVPCLCKSETDGCLKEHLIKEIENSLKELKSILGHDTVLPGETYIRWGRTTCPNDSSFVYDGYAGGKGYITGGSGSNFLCLPKDPEWNKFTEGVYGGGIIYGVEYEILNEKPYSKSFHDKDMPCAVCLSSKRSAILMVPGKVHCYDGWHKEYSGYLMSESNIKDRSPSEYICVDEELEAVPGGEANQSQAVVYPVEAMCGQLKCPPYVEGRELACVVCSR